MRHKPRSISGTHQLQIPLLPCRIHPKRLKVRMLSVTPGSQMLGRTWGPDLPTLLGEVFALRLEVPGPAPYTQVHTTKRAHKSLTPCEMQNSGE